MNEIAGMDAITDSMAFGIMEEMKSRGYRMTECVDFDQNLLDLQVNSFKIQEKGI